MKCKLTAEEATRLGTAMETCLAIARTYRMDIADEDSILLLEELITADEILETGHARKDDHHLLELPE